MRLSKAFFFFAIGLYLASTGCASVETGAGKALDNANSVIRSRGGDTKKLWDPEPAKCREADECSNDSQASNE